MFAPYPLPPVGTGPADNPGRQPSLVQAIALLAGAVLLFVLVYAASSDGSAVLGFSMAAGAAGLVLGLTIARIAASRTADSRIRARR